MRKIAAGAETQKLNVPTVWVVLPTWLDGLAEFMKAVVSWKREAQTAAVLKPIKVFKILLPMILMPEEICYMCFAFRKESGEPTIDITPGDYLCDFHERQSQETGGESMRAVEAAASIAFGRRKSYPI